MRLLARRALLPLLASSLLCACAGEAKIDPPITSASGTPATRTSGAPSSGAAPVAPSGPVRVALVAREPVVLSEAGGDTWIVGSKSGKVAVDKKGELAEREALTGLPLDTASIARVEGRLPGSVWVSLAAPDPDKKRDRAPLYRHFKTGWREIAPDWNPEIVPWSKNRMLAGSTSSGKLKLKIVEPQTEKSPADMPSRRIGDDACQKSFKLRDLAALPDGTLFGVGRCTVQKKASYVAVRWLASPAPETAPAPKASGSRRPKRGPGASASASALASATATALGTASASAAPEPASAAPAGSAPPPASAAPEGSAEPVPATSGSAEAGGDGDDGGVPAVLDVIGPDLARHRSLVVVSSSEAYVAGAAGDEGSSARVWRFDVDRWSPVELPALTGALEGLARTADGTLWLATRAELWRQAPRAGWQRVPLPTEVAGAAASGWELYAVGASGDTVWVSARAVLASGERRVVLALGAGAAAGGEPILWE